MSESNSAVAIVGIGAIFPGAGNPEQFWSRIAAGETAVRTVPEGRWPVPPDSLLRSGIPHADAVYSTRGCFVDDRDIRPDYARLAIDASLVEALDPMFRLGLYAAQQAFDDAAMSAVDLARTGLIIGNIVLPTEKSSLLAREYLGGAFAEKITGQVARPTTDPHDAQVAGLPGGLIARALGLGGGSHTLDAACASSLYALKLAADELISGRRDAMISGGLSRPDCLYTQMGFAQLRALSPSGLPRPFDAAADGLVVGEGAGMFVLKRLPDALAAGDHIYGVIRGIGLSNDMDGGLLAPSSEGQLRAMREAYRRAGWQPQDVELIECHATGTPLGDQVEFESLRQLWQGGGEAGGCVLGAVKSNVGHLLTAAGSAALIKVLLAMRARILPPNANFAAPSPRIPLAGSPFDILRESRPWPQGERPRRAAVSAFGFGGINAHVLIEEWRPATARPAFEPALPAPPVAIAVVGLATKIGGWPDLAAFERRVLGTGEEREPREGTRFWGVDKAGWFRQSGMSAPRGHYLDQVEIPFGAFRIPPKELEEMLPQQLLMLQAAAAAAADAGLAQKGDAAAGVFIGIGLDLNTTNFQLRWVLERDARLWAARLGRDLSEAEMYDWVAALRASAGPALTANRTMGALGGMVASRVARELRFGGPSFTISSEETSGLHAFTAAVRALQNGSLDTALVGAVDLAGECRALFAAQQLKRFSSAGQARPFDDDADGALPGEGAVALVLKRYDDALAAGDRIYACVQGLGTATGPLSDGAAPQAETYATSLRRACDEAGLAPSRIDYLEAQASGRPVEDRAEWAALQALFGDQPPPLGCLTAAIGHTGAATGLVALVRACLALYREVLPPGEQPARPIAVAARPGTFGRKPSYWLRNRRSGARVAAVANFSGEGNCAHVLLTGPDAEHVKAPPRLRPARPLQRGLFIVEGDQPDELCGALQALGDFARAHSDEDVAALAALRWPTRASSKRLAMAFVAESVAELGQSCDTAREALQRDPERPHRHPAYLNLARREAVFYHANPLGKEAKIAFVFPGSGNHFAGMGRETALTWSGLFQALDARSGLLADQFPRHLFWSDLPTADLADHHRALLSGQICLGVAISDLVRALGVEPQAAIGYSLGESVAFYAFDVWPDREVMFQRMMSSDLFTTRLAGPCLAVKQAWGLGAAETVDWIMGVVNRAEELVRAALAGEARAYLLIVNTHRECVIGGDRAAVNRVVAALDSGFFEIKGAITVHCQVLAPVAQEYHDLHLMETVAPTGIRFYSCHHGKVYEPTRTSIAGSILDQAQHGVDFPKTIEAAYDDGCRIFIEMGPGNSCTRMIGNILRGKPHLARPVCFPGARTENNLLRLFAALAVERINLPADYPFAAATASQPDVAVPAPARLTIPVGGAPFNPPMPPARAAAVAGKARPVIQPMAPPPAPAPVAVAAMPKAVAIGESLPVGRSAGVADTLADQMVASFSARARAHEAFLSFSRSNSASMHAHLEYQAALLQAMGGVPLAAPSLQPAPVRSAEPAQAPAPAPTPESTAAATLQTVDEPFLDRAACLAFATGRIGDVLGPEFAAIDAHPTRVRLPDEPLMLVDRILEVGGERMRHGHVVTEHDIHAGAWYLDGGRIPTCIAVEAGQADLFLSAWLGIDFETKGRAVYRLLDAVVTFHRALPGPGEVIHYHIRIDQFFRQGDTHLFRFSFEGSVNCEPLLSMRDGCAGFFSAAELEAGKGIVQTERQLRTLAGQRPEDWTELVPMSVAAYDTGQIEALRRGDLAGCFGDLFQGLPLERPLGLPAGRMKLVDRVLHLDPKGGRFGLGFIRAEADIHPDDWFLTCHFVDDRVMPGTLMYECCLHSLRIFLLRMGWVAEADEVICQPVPGVGGVLKCRGQVLETTSVVTYEVTIAELGYRPEPYAVVEALMYADGKPIVKIDGMSLRMTGLTRQRLEQIWSRRGTAAPQRDLYDRERILAFAIGRPSVAFGANYEVFDEERVIARLPGPPFLFMDGVTKIAAEPWKMKAGGRITTRYDVPADAWYFAANRQRGMPFAVLLEIALQPCGWFAGYLGSALTAAEDLSFRNLGGSAVQYRAVLPESGALHVDVACTGVSNSGGMIIQHYDFLVRDSQGPVYEGNTYFGFFSKKALANQVGLRDAALFEPDSGVRGEAFAYPDEAPFPEASLRMLDRIDCYLPEGGPQGLGFISGSFKIQPDAWFFKAHFYQDPVVPGSLGLESGLQLLKVFADRRWGSDPATGFQTVSLGRKHHWSYRGQVVPTDERVTVQAVITAIDDDVRMLTADGYLSVDGRHIYHLQEFTLSMT